MVKFSILAKNIRKKWKKPSLLPNEPIHICKVCFKEFESFSVHSLFLENEVICKECLTKYGPIFKEFTFEGCQGLAIYQYKDLIREKLFQLKGCYDYELHSSFLSFYKNELRAKYSGFVVIPIPSNKDDDEKRGFNHVEEIFKSIGFQLTKILMKTQHFKQANLNFIERKNVKNVLALNENMKLKENSKILLVDDVMTTGASMHSSIELIKKFKPKIIKILVMSKTELKKKTTENIKN